MKNINDNAGFTLIELVIVIVILGVLAVTAAPRFIDLSDDANDSVTLAQMGAFKSGVNLLHAKWQIRRQSSISISGQTVEFTDDGWPKGSTDDSAGCAELWSEVFADAEPVTVLNNYTDTLSAGWNAFYYGEVCGYIKSQSGGGTVYPSNTPHFAYYMTDFSEPSAGYTGSPGEVKIYNL